LAENTKIEWAHHTFNPWVGCTKVSPGCDNCYAEGWANRTGQAGLWSGERRRTSPANWAKVIKWDRAAEAAGERHRVFCASLADVFDNQADKTWRDLLWNLIHQTKHLDWLLLTKRPQNIAKMLPLDWDAGWPNVWLGTTVENQEEADRRIPHLLAVPAAVRFLSCEPLLGPVNLSKWFPVSRVCGAEDRSEETRQALAQIVNAAWRKIQPAVIDWVICGGESGPKARPMHPDWARSLRDQCQAAGVAFHFKQWGEWSPSTPESASGNPRSGWQCLAGHPHAPRAKELCPEAGAAFIERVGKANAGRLLDGREWNEFPDHWDRLRGAAPDATGNLKSEAFVRAQRAERDR
jgi:protein gp37